MLLDGVEYQHVQAVKPADLDLVMSGLIGQKLLIGNTIPIGSDNQSLPALLLLVGRADLAAKSFRRMDGDRAAALFEAMRVRYQLLAADAIMNRRDAEGLDWARCLTTISMAHEKYPFKPDRLAGSPVPQSDPGFAPSLLADFYRRVEQPKPEPMDLSSLLKLERRKRIGALMANMDTITAHQFSQPGDLEYMSDPLFVEITKQGTAVVPYLIAAMRGDSRFTRSVSYWRDFMPYRFIHPVKDAAWNAIMCAWPSAVAAAGKDINKPPDVALLESLWKRDGKLSEPERWLNILRDDSAGERLWLQACRYIVKPVDEIWISPNAWMISRKANPGMTGNALRKGHDSEVSLLMAKRAIQSASVVTNSSIDIVAASDALRMAHCLRIWRPASSLDCARKVCKFALDTLDRLGRPIDVANTIAEPFGELVADREQGGDSSAVKDYAALLGLLSREDYTINNAIFKPMWSSTNPAMQDLGSSYFNGWRGRAASGDPVQAERTVVATCALARSPILSLPYFRKIFVAALENPSIAGKLEMDATGKNLRYKLAEGGSGYWNLRGKARALPSPTLRVNDYAAELISTSGIKGFPRFDITGSETARATQRGKLIAMLKNDEIDWISIAKTSPFFGLGQEF